MSREINEGMSNIGGADEIGLSILGGEGSGRDVSWSKVAVFSSNGRDETGPTPGAVMRSIRRADTGCFFG